MLKLPATTSQQEVIVCQGGMDITTPTLMLKPGVAKQAQNFHARISGGYERIMGYERYDGRPAPSDAQYSGLNVTITGAIVAGDTITGDTSGATGVVIYVSGSLVVFTKAAGTPFVVGEGLEVSAVVQGTVTAIDAIGTTPDYFVQMQALAAEVYRADIGAVPGSGPIRGVFRRANRTYALRDNAGGTALDLYVDGASGWTQITYPNTLDYTLGTSQYNIGSTITQGGASATVKRVTIESGSFGAGDAAGRIIIGAVTGGPFAAGVAGGGGAVTLSGAEAAITLLPGGSVEVDAGAVGGTRRYYWIDGVNPCCEFDGNNVIPIHTGNTIDIPEHVLVHSSHLFLSFGNSLQHSAIGDPYNWTALLGAGEFHANSGVTALHRMQGNQGTATAAIFHENGMEVLYGTSEADFQLVVYEDSAGAKPKTAQSIGAMFSLDDRGVTALNASQDFGNFAASTLTLPIYPFIVARRNLATGSAVNRQKNHYRVFFSDGWGLYITIANRKLVGSMPVRFAHPVLCCYNSETPDGSEMTFFGGADGWVYQLDKGTSFDGEEIEAYIQLGWANQKMPRRNKRYRKATVEIAGDSYCEFQLGHQLSYQSAEREQPSDYATGTAQLTGAQWDVMTWDDFVWDSASIFPTEVGIDGSGENIQFAIYSKSAVWHSFAVNCIVNTFSPRRQMR